MAASITKDRFTAIWTHPISANSSIKDFSAKLEAQAESLLALPSAKNLLKYDLIIPNNKLNNAYKALGFPEPQPVVLVKIECESAGHCAQFLRDAEATNKISKTQEFAGASIFSVDVITKIDAGSADGCDACVGIFKSPPHLSRTQFHEFVDKASNGFVALPTMQKNAIKQIMVCSSPNVFHITEYPPNEKSGFRTKPSTRTCKRLGFRPRRTSPYSWFKL
ncbi:hypothetical protein C8R45DRAFT_203303 [Mycena sanguinolenta]|nr:hypothetical protein C8R45DRAFT_203303 [Mycena sanguinolenta]